jgi:hypothetical protein
MNSRALAAGIMRRTQEKSRTPWRRQVGILGPRKGKAPKTPNLGRLPGSPLPSLMAFTRASRGSNVSPAVLVSSWHERVRDTEAGGLRPGDVRRHLHHFKPDPLRPRAIVTSHHDSPKKDTGRSIRNSGNIWHWIFNLCGSSLTVMSRPFAIGMESAPEKDW